MKGLEEILRLFPCHPLNENNKYYKGKINVCDREENCCKCEYIYILMVILYVNIIVIMH